MSDIDNWLGELGLAQYAPAFAENGLDLRALRLVSEADLETLGVLLGHRRILLDAIARLPGDDHPAPGAGSAADAVARPPVADAERRQLTVMFCDMVGSTALSTQLDPEDYREVMRAYQDACAGVITRYDGYVARFMGDGVLTYFGWPRAHEDDAARAINVGLGVVAAVAGLAQPVAVRIGIATGPVVIGDIVGEAGAQEAAVTGETPNLAARLETAAPANTVVISGHTKALAGGLFDYESLGTQELKGFDGDLELWRVVGERQVESRFAAAHGQQLTPLIGREEELELLTRRWRRVVDGEGQVVLLSGEPGIGKSRLTRALQDTLADEAHVRVLLQCSPHHTSSSLYPVINHLELAAGFTTGDGAAARLAKLEDLLAQDSAVPGDTVALIAALLSVPADDRYPLPALTPQQQKEHTLAALNEHLAWLSAQQPVLFVVEDAHWIDPTTLELIELAIERLRDLPVLLVITYRPEFTAPWVGDDHVSLLALNRLTRRDRVRMAQSLLGEAISEDILAQIAERSDGIPLFVEELTRAAGEAEAGSEIPATLHDALEARFDRSPAVREVAQVGAAIGREFDYALLARVTSQAPEDLDGALDDLVGSGLIFVRGAPPEASYTFKHALIQDTAYSSMVRSRRHETHRQIAEALPALQPEIAESEPETLAHHYTEANLLDAAVDWWTKAGQAASAQSANPEAVTLYGRGLEVIRRLPESENRDRLELVILTGLFGPIINVKGQVSAELESAINRTLEICERVDAPQEMFRALWAKGIFHGMRGEHGLCGEISELLVERAEQMSDQGALLIGQRMVGLSKFLHGDVAGGMVHTNYVLEHYDDELHGYVTNTYGQNPAIISEAYNSISEWILGRPDVAHHAFDRAKAKALELDHVGTMGPTFAWGAQLGQTLRRDVEGLRQSCEQMTQMTSVHRMPIWELVEFCAKAFLANLEASSNATIEQVLVGLNRFSEMASNSMLWPFYWSSIVADTYCTLERPDEALAASEKAFALADNSGEHWSDAELFRVRGVALALRDGAAGNDEAESWLRRAIEDARARQAKSFELRAAMSLARLLRDQGRTSLARETLAPVYGWFTEGFDTPDLIDAKALLDELS